MCSSRGLTEPCVWCVWCVWCVCVCVWCVCGGVKHINISLLTLLPSPHHSLTDASTSPLTLSPSLILSAPTLPTPPPVSPPPPSPFSSPSLVPHSTFILSLSPSHTPHSKSSLLSNHGSLIFPYYPPLTLPSPTPPHLPLTIASPHPNTTPPHPPLTLASPTPTLPHLIRPSP